MAKTTKTKAIKGEGVHQFWWQHKALLILAASTSTISLIIQLIQMRKG